jgi:ABC-type xylose transport system permease subunit
MAIAELIVGFFLIAWGLAFFLLAGEFSPPLNPSDMGPDILPKLISLVQFLLGVAWIVQAVRRRKDSGKFTIKHPANILAMMSLLLAYAWAIPVLGYYLSTGLFLPAMLLLAMERRWPRIVGTTIVFILFAWGAFDLLLKVPLPK